MNKKKNAMRQRRAFLTTAKILSSCAVLLIMAFIGLLWFLRPDTSVIEKRTLTAFPKLTWTSFWDGTFFNDDANGQGVSAWYSDTYPLREPLIAGFQSLQDHYGIRGDQIVGTQGVAEAIPTTANLDDLGELEADESETSAAEALPGEAQPAESQPPVEEAPVDGTVTESGEMAGGLYITQNCAYQLFYFTQDIANDYIRTMNKIYDNIGDKVNMYVMIPPNSTTVMLDQSILDDIGCSNEADAINYLYSGMKEGIRTVDTFSKLKAHNSEYIFFHTDHHWTGLGAYYGYQAFCDAKGITPHDVNDYETMSIDGFMGTLYASSGNSAELAANPDTVTGYIPKGTNTMFMEWESGMVEWPIINDISDYPNTEYYGMFSGGDQPFSYIHNETITDGSAVLMIKDSYGNSFVPWLVDHYEYVYWIDYRSTNYTVLELVEEYGIQDVIYECQVFNTVNDYAQERYLEIGS